MSSESEAELTKKMAHEVLLTEPEISLTPEIPQANYDKQHGLVIKLPHGCLLSATIYERNDGYKSAFIDMMTVNPRLKSNAKGTGFGIGKKLLSELKNFAEQENIEVIVGNIQSKPALAIRAKVFGEENTRVMNPEFEGQTIKDILADEDLQDNSLNLRVISKLKAPENDLDLAYNHDKTE